MQMLHLHILSDSASCHLTKKRKETPKHYYMKVKLIYMYITEKLKLSRVSAFLCNTKKCKKEYIKTSILYVYTIYNFYIC